MLSQQRIPALPVKVPGLSHVNECLPSVAGCASMNNDQQASGFTEGNGSVAQEKPSVGTQVRFSCYSPKIQGTEYEEVGGNYT